MKKRTIPFIFLLVLVSLFLGFNLVQGAGTSVLTNADGSNYFTMTSSSSLNTLINQVTSRIKVAMANELNYQTITVPPAEFSEFFNSISNRIKTQFAGGIMYYSITYPKDLVGDTTNPFVVQTSLSSGYLYITANELTTMVFQYGLTTGSYPNEVNDPLFGITHTVPLSLFPAQQQVYYRVLLVDRSGNQSLSEEFVFNTPMKLYIPFIRSR